MPGPNARAVQICQAALAGELPDSAEDQELAFIFNSKLIPEHRRGTDIDPDVSIAYELHIYPERHVMNALLLVQCPTDKIQEALGLTARTVALYQKYFFDTSVFRTAFAARRFVRNIPNDGSEEYKAYELALTEGWVPLLARYRLTDALPVDPVDAANFALTEFLSRGREHRQLKLTSATAKESLGALKNAVSTAQAIHGMRPKDGGYNAAHELRIALVPVDTTYRAEASPVPVGDLIRSGPTPEPTAPKTE